MEARAFIAMRYWHPMSDAVAREVRDWDPDHVVLLPLYPQFSTTTTGSSLSAWREAASRAGLMKPVSTLCCYHSDPAYIAAMAGLVRRTVAQARAALPSGQGLRILFSAHGLPEVIVQRGDPYQFQVERTVAGVVAALDMPGLDTAICYQSRATPQKWIGPSTEDEIERAGKDGVAVVVVPIAFVSEHSETLVELDVEYRELAEKHGIHGYFRVPAANADAAFIAALAGLVRRVLAAGPGMCSADGGTCPAAHGDCPNIRAARPPVNAAAFETSGAAA
jgi:ferrochelatase